jgi:hypothetical protein
LFAMCIKLSIRAGVLKMPRSWGSSEVGSLYQARSRRSSFEHSGFALLLSDREYLEVGRRLEQGAY